MKVNASYLNHLDADKSVKSFFKFSRNLAIVHKMNANTTLEASLSNTFFCEMFLLNGERQGINFTAK